MTHYKEYNNSIQLTLSYVLVESFIMPMSDNEEDECLLELHANSNLMLSSHQKLLSFQKKRLLCLQNKVKLTKCSHHRPRRTKSRLYRNNVSADGIYEKIDQKTKILVQELCFVPKPCLKKIQEKFQLRFRLPHRGFTLTS